MSKKLKLLGTAAVMLGLSVWLFAARPVEPEIATTTTSTNAATEPVYTQKVNPDGSIEFVFVGFRPSDNAALYANADVNGDGINDMIMVVVDSPTPPPGFVDPAVTSIPAQPARYRLYVASGATGLTLINISIASPGWYSSGDPF